MSQLDTNTIKLNNILTKINNLPEKQNLSVVTATASDVLSPKVIVGSDGQPITGTMYDFSFVENNLLDTQWEIDGDNLKTVSPTIWQGYVDSIHTTVPQYQIANAINLSSEQIAEGETILGITGTHSGGLRSTWVTSLTGELTFSDSYSKTVTITGVGYPARYILLEFDLYYNSSTTNPSQLLHWYSFNDSGTLQYPSYGLYNYTYYTAYGTSTQSSGIVNTESTISFIACAASGYMKYAQGYVLG